MTASTGYGYLAPQGAIYVRSEVNASYPYNWLYEWRNGVLTRLTGVNSGYGPGGSEQITF